MKKAAAQFDLTSRNKLIPFMYSKPGKVCA